MTAPLGALVAATTPVQREDYDISPGLLGFMVVFVIGIALWLLLRSMVGHLRRVDVTAHDRERHEVVAPDPAGPAS